MNIFEKTCNNNTKSNSITVHGFLDQITPISTTITKISGWSLVEIRNGEFTFPEKISVFSGEDILTNCSLNINREDVIQSLNASDNLITCGFDIEVSHKPINNIENSLGVLISHNQQSRAIPGPYGCVLPMLPREIIENQDDKLIHYPRINNIALAITSKCNLRCSYCFIHCPEYVAEDLDTEILDKTKKELSDLNVREIHFGIMGEPTVHKDFFSMAKELHRGGYKLSLATNLAKILSDEQILTLLKFDTLEISIDTFNIDHARKLRAGSDSRTILLNLTKLHSLAYLNDITVPKITISAVINELNVFDLPELVTISHMMKIPQVQLLDMRLPYKDADFSDIPSRLTYSSIKDDAKEALNQTISLLNKFSIQTSIDSALTAFIEDSDEDETGLDPLTLEKPTRLCIAPWSRLYVNADGEVTPCFNFSEIGKINNNNSIQDCWNGPRMKQIRKELLEGQLESGCQSCCRAEACSTKDLEDLVYKFSQTKDPVRGETFGQPIDFIL